MIAFTLSIFCQLVKNDVLDKNNAVCRNLANGNPMMTATQLPTMPVMMRRWWWRGWWWRWWWRRRYEMPAVVVAVMMMVDGSTVHVSSGCGHSNTRDCSCRTCGDEFDLVHGMVPSVFAQAHSRAYTELGLVTGIF